MPLPDRRSNARLDRRSRPWKRFPQKPVAGVDDRWSCGDVETVHRRNLSEFRRRLRGAGVTRKVPAAVIRRQRGAPVLPLASCPSHPAAFKPVSVHCPIRQGYCRRSATCWCPTDDAGSCGRVISQLHARARKATDLPVDRAPLRRVSVPPLTMMLPLKLGLAAVERCYRCR
jgi:hypothetical protein